MSRLEYGASQEISNHEGLSSAWFKILWSVPTRRIVAPLLTQFFFEGKRELKIRVIARMGR
jgi:hypothetical protein